MFQELKKKFNVFHLHMPYFEKEADEKNIKQWSSFIGPENVLIFENPKAVIDVMLGAIALKSRTRTLDQYIAFDIFF
jgi:ABC-type sulfate transport system substrate-binding protein